MLALVDLRSLWWGHQRDHMSGDTRENGVILIDPVSFLWDNVEV